MRACCALCVGLVASCGRVNYDVGDAAPDVAAPVEAFPEGAMFDAPTPVPALADPAEDDDPSLTDDLLEMYFSSKRAGGGDIYRATRASVTDPWSAPSLVAELSSPSNDEQPGIAPDGLTIWFASSRAPSFGAADIWVATRSDRTSPWSTPTRVVELSSAAEDLGVHPDRTLLHMMMYRYAAMTTGAVFEARRASIDAAWNAPTLIAELDGAFENISPHLVTERELLFVSTRPGGAGNRDLWLARRTSIDVPFDAPIALTELNSSALDDDPWASADGRYIVFATERSGNREIWHATRP